MKDPLFVHRRLPNEQASKEYLVNTYGPAAQKTFTGALEAFFSSEFPQLAGDRARRNLDQAEKLLEKALAANPEQSAYLDTMAEIQFARGNREKALEWSQRAVNFMSLDVMLRRQHERFRSAPLPR